MVDISDSGSRGRGFEPHSGRRVVSLSKTYLHLKSTGNTQEAVAPSQHDWKIVYRDIKHQIKPNILSKNVMNTFQVLFLCKKAREKFLTQILAAS